MADYAELYALVYEGKVRGYRIYAISGDKSAYYDFQTSSTSLEGWVLGRIKLTRHGRYLVSDAELQGKCKPIKVNKVTDELRYLIELAKSSYRSIWG